MSLIVSSWWCWRGIVVQLCLAKSHHNFIITFAVRALIPSDDFVSTDTMVILAKAKFTSIIQKLNRRGHKRKKSLYYIYTQKKKDWGPLGEERKETQEDLLWTFIICLHYLNSRPLYNILYVCLLYYIGKTAAV